jgi:formylglycine-generating enzyme required for sulfatase activity
MGAGTVCSNLKSDKRSIVIHGEKEYPTGLRKIGGILGDGADVGCGAVINPGTVIGKNTRVYPLTMLRGVYPADCIVKGTENVTVETLSEAPDAGFNADQYKKDKIVLKRIRAGRFRMGSPDSEGGRKQNETLHDVILTNDYWIGVFPVTRQQWMHIRKDVTPGDHYYLTGPAIDVSWNDICGENGGRSGTTAVDEGSFLGLLGAKVNQSLPQGYVVALPTEAQWEYACRAGTDTAWNNGTDYNVYDKTADSGSYAGNVFKVDDNLNLLARYVWTTRAVANQNNSTKVGCFQPNAWGLYDCHGNCFELVFDSIYVEGGGSGPSGVQTEQRVNRYPNYRIVKGGTWNSPAKECRSAARYHIDRSLRDGKYGFRLAIIKEVK